MAKILVPATSFDPATRQVVLPFAVELARVYAVINATRGVTYYTIGDPAQVATVSGSTITLNLSFGGGGHSASDRISVWYETTDAQPVSDGGASLTVDGPLTNAELRASPVPVTQSSQPLPTGAATAANQATANTTLGSILTELGQKLEPADLAPLATEATLAAVLAKIIAAPATEATLEAARSLLASRLPQSASGALLVGNNKSKIRDEFPTGGLSPALWETIATGAGQSIATGNGTTGSYLLITSGTTPNAETIIRSRDIFTLPVRLAATVTASQRIANTEFFIEIIEVDAAGAPITVAASQPNAGVWRNHAAIKFEGTTPTNARLSVRSGGAPEFQAAQATTQTTAATGTGPNWFPVGWFEAQLTGEHAALLQAPIDSTAAATVASRITQAAPNPDALYKLQIRLRNLGVAPASSTDYRVHALRLFDYTRMTTEIIGGVGHSAEAMGVPVRIAGTPTVTANIGTGSLAAGTNAVGDVGIQYRANATGAASRFHLIAGGSVNASVVKAAAGRLLGWRISNPTASWRYVKLHNQTTTPTAGSGVVETIGIPPGQTITDGRDGGIGFGTGIALTTVTGIADADATAVTANDLSIDLQFA